MTNPYKLLLLTVFAALALAFAPKAQAITIEIGDRGYYTHGASYWRGGYEYYWVPGHWGPRKRWIHGHYVKRVSGPAIRVRTPRVILHSW